MVPSARSLVVIFQSAGKGTPALKGGVHRRHALCSKGVFHLMPSESPQQGSLLYSADSVNWLSPVMLSYDTC